MKKNYNDLKIEIVVLECEDILTNSSEQGIDVNDWFN